MDVHKTICAVDIAGFGGNDRTRTNYVAIREGMHRSLTDAFLASGIPWGECYQEINGDSVLVLAPAAVPKGKFVERLPLALAAALHAFNEEHPSDERIKLRLALHAGEITHDNLGVTAPAIIHTFRLLEAKPLKAALADSPGALAMIASDWFFDEVIRHHPEHEPDSYRQVNVDVKETHDVGWIRLPGHELPAGPLVAVAGEPIVLMPAPRPASPEFYEVVDALERISCMQSEHERSLVIEQLRFAGSIKYFANRRTHLTSILRTCLDYEDGVLELVTVIVNQEPAGSVPLKHLLSLLSGGRM